MQSLLPVVAASSSISTAPSQFSSCQHSPTPKQGELEFRQSLHGPRIQDQEVIEMGEPQREDRSSHGARKWWLLDSEVTFTFLRTGGVGLVTLLATLTGWIIAFRHRPYLPAWLHAVFLVCVGLEAYYIFRGACVLYLPLRKRQLLSTPNHKHLRQGDGGTLMYSPPLLRRWTERVLGCSPQTLFPTRHISSRLPPYEHAGEDGGDQLDEMVERARRGGSAPSCTSSCAL